VADILTKMVNVRFDSSCSFGPVQILLAAVRLMVPAALQLPTSHIAGLISKAINNSLDHPEGVSLLTQLLPDLCQQLPAVQQLQVSQVADICSKAINKGLQYPDRISLLTALLAALCQQLPAAQQLPVSCVVNMMFDVIKHPCHLGLSDHDTNELLLVVEALPAAQQISEETAGEILQLCVMQQGPLLFVQQPMQQLGVASVRSPLYEAFDWFR
jgi:hypothetical protein